MVIGALPPACDRSACRAYGLLEPYVPCSRGKARVDGRHRHLLVGQMCPGPKIDSAHEIRWARIELIALAAQPRNVASRCAGLSGLVGKPREAAPFPRLTTSAWKAQRHPALTAPARLRLPGDACSQGQNCGIGGGRNIGDAGRPAQQRIGRRERQGKLRLCPVSFPVHRRPKPRPGRTHPARACRPARNRARLRRARPDPKSAVTLRGSPSSPPVMNNTPAVGASINPTVKTPFGASASLLCRSSTTDWEADVMDPSRSRRRLASSST